MSLLRPASLIFLSVLTVLPGWGAENCRSEVPRVNRVRTPTDGGIRVTVADKYRPRFEKWKAEFLATAYGHRVWEEYAANKEFILRLVVSADRKRGAGTDDFEWDASGRLVGATITLGTDIHEGYPAPIYYPVLNALDSPTNSPILNGRILAAAKISHEFAHVRQIRESNMALLQTQGRLIPLYVSIFRKNGLKADDPRLVEIANEMGGTPVNIWERREYQSEVAAMKYIHERITNTPFYCSIFNRIRRNLESFAPMYEPQFSEHPEFTASACGGPGIDRSIAGG